MNQPKVKYMGKELLYEELPEADAVSMEDYFAPVKLTPGAIEHNELLVPLERGRLHKPPIALRKVTQQKFHSDFVAVEFGRVVKPQFGTRYRLQ